MTPYDEGEVLAFIDDASAAYREAGRQPDAHALVWPSRMTYDAISIGWAASRAKHLAEVRAALGLSGAPSAPGPSLPQTVESARTIVKAATDANLDLLLGPFMSDDEGSEACGRLVLICLAQLAAAGLRGARQRNPSGVISNDKLCVFVAAGSDAPAWHAFDIASIGGLGHPGTPGWLEVLPSNPV